MAESFTSSQEQSEGAGDTTEECQQLSESRYILAKYRLQQSPSATTPKTVEEADLEREGPIGPEFLRK